MSDAVYAWVIEHSDSSPSQPRYWTGRRHGAIEWSDPGDHEAAVRFARKEDAERVALYMGYYPPNPTHRICEHGWVGCAVAHRKPVEVSGNAWERAERAAKRIVYTDGSLEDVIDIILRETALAAEIERADEVEAECRRIRNLIQRALEGWGKG